MSDYCKCLILCWYFSKYFKTGATVVLDVLSKCARQAYLSFSFIHIWIYRMLYHDIIMGTIAFQITSLTVVYSIVYSDADQRKHQSSASLAFVWGIHRDRWIPRTKSQLRGKCFHLMTSPCVQPQNRDTYTRLLPKFNDRDKCKFGDVELTHKVPHISLSWVIWR